MNNKVLNDVETSKYIGMSTSWLRMARCTGNPDAPPFIKIGRSVRYRLNDLDAWLNSRVKYNTLEA
jgi:predicted DNA-binding transcriptional regulator AlpA